MMGSFEWKGDRRDKCLLSKYMQCDYYAPHFLLGRQSLIRSPGQESLFGFSKAMIQIKSAYSTRTLLYFFIRVFISIERVFFFYLYLQIIILMHFYLYLKAIILIKNVHTLGLKRPFVYLVIEMITSNESFYLLCFFSSDKLHITEIVLFGY